MKRDFLLKRSDTATPSHVNSQFWYTSRIPKHIHGIAVSTCRTTPTHARCYIILLLHHPVSCEGEAYPLQFSRKQDILFFLCKKSNYIPLFISIGKYRSCKMGNTVH